VIPKQPERLDTARRLQELAFFSRGGETSQDISMGSTCETAWRRNACLSRGASRETHLYLQRRGAYELQPTQLPLQELSPRATGERARKRRLLQRAGSVKLIGDQSPSYGIGRGCGVGRGLGVGLGVPGAWISTVIGEPVLKKPTVALAVCGGWLASNRKLYNVPQRIALAF